MKLLVEAPSKGGLIGMHKKTLFQVQQELSYRLQIARQLRTQYAEGIYRLITP